MHGDAIVAVATIDAVRRKIIHGRDGRDADFCQLAAREEHRLNVDIRGRAGPDDELEGAGGADAVQQGVDGHRLRAGFRLHQPELAEGREFLACRGGRRDGHAARGRAVDCAGAEDTEEARALEADEVVKLARGVQRGGDVEAGIAERLLVLIRQGKVEEIEVCFGPGFRRRHTIVDDVELDLFVEQVATRIVVNAERDRRVRRPLSGFALELEAAVLVVVERCGGGRNRTRFLEVMFGERLRLVDDLLERERSLGWSRVNRGNRFECRISRFSLFRRIVGNRVEGFDDWRDGGGGRCRVCDGDICIGDRTGNGGAGRAG